VSVKGDTEGCLLLTNCHAIMGGGEISLLRHLDYSVVPRDRIIVALLNDGPLRHEIEKRCTRCVVVGRSDRDGEFPGYGEIAQIGLRIRRICQTNNVKWIMSYTAPDLLACSYINVVSRIKVFWRSQGEQTIFAPRRHINAFQRLLVLASRCSVNRVFCTTQRDAIALGSWGVPEGKISTIYLGIEDEWFRPKATVVKTDSRVRAAISGRLVPWKGHRTFIHALAKVAEQGVSIEGWIIGDGDPAYRNELEELAGRLIPGRVKFWGHISNVRNVLQECDVLLHCSSREPFGLSIVEAMALELPVIAADVEGPREIITNGIDGLLVPPNDVDAYAAHLLRLSLDDDHRNSIAKKAHMTANERFRAIINIKQMERQMIASCQ